ncbi:MAG TPA: hypothetical protein VF806_10115 [Anaerolineaceae bacterium]
MRSKNHLVMPLAVLALLICVIAFKGSTGFAQENQPNQGIVENPGAEAAQVITAANPPVLGAATISIGSEAFHPWNRTSTLDRSGTMMIRPLTPAGNSAALDAPLYLPQGAEIKQIVAYIVDNDATYNVELLFALHPYTASMGSTSDFVHSSGQSAAIQYIALSGLSKYRYIDNTTYSYLIRVDMVGGANMWLNSVRVDYSYPNKLPAIMKQ